VQPAQQSDTNKLQNSGTMGQLGLRVNMIYAWLPRKGGKIDMRVGRAVAMAACPAPFLGWVGGKAGNNLVSPRK
jgi:hypothetical protein